MKFFIWIILLFLFTACETFSGVRSYSDEFPTNKLANKDCIQKAIETTPGIKYLRNEDQGKTKLTSWDGKEDQSEYTHSFYYSVDTLPTVRKYEGKVFIIRKYNGNTTLMNSFGLLNTSYTKQERKSAYDVISKLNTKITESCKLGIDLKIVK